MTLKCSILTACYERFVSKNLSLVDFIFCLLVFEQIFAVNNSVIVIKNVL